MEHGPFDIRFKHPSTIIIAGNTNSGKSSFVQKLIRYKNQLITPRINRIIYCFSEYKPRLAYDHMTTYSRGYSESLISKEKLGSDSETLLVIDDLSDEVKPDEMTRLFTKLSHHRR